MEYVGSSVFDVGPLMGIGQTSGYWCVLGPLHRKVRSQGCAFLLFKVLCEFLLPLLHTDAACQ